MKTFSAIYAAILIVLVAVAALAEPAKPMTLAGIRTMTGRNRKPARTREDWLNEFTELCRPHFNPD